MTNYTKTTNFASKDTLPSGNANKIVKGTEIDTEFNNIATAVATKADTAGPTLTGTTTFETLSDGTISITAFVDEDNMASDSATLLPTQQSVKAYVDSQVTAQDLDFQADTGGALSIDLDSETLTLTGGTGIDTSGALNAVTFAIDATVATLTGSQTLSNKTLSTPVVSGNLTTDGLIDGRDVATDGTKLDGIESGATADQTAAEIKTAYESNADTNAFTDADESKLDGIEALADVTDTANVTAAGALMDSELTDIAAVKALNQGVATTDSPTFAGLTTSADISFGDNDKAIFGAGSDLQIYHDGSNSRIQDAGIGTGNLGIWAENLFLQNADGSANYATASLNGSFTLSYNNSQKLATTSTGIDVTGTATMDGLTVDGSLGSFAVQSSGAEVHFSRNDNNDILANGGTSASFTIGANNNLTFKTGATLTQRLQIASNGDLSLYEDTGTTPKFFWDASAERLELTNLKLYSDNVRNEGGILYIGTSGNYATQFYNNDANTVHISGAGNVGIGTNSPETALHVYSTGNTIARITSGTSNIAGLDLGDTAGTDVGRIRYDNSTNSLAFTTATNEAMRINSSGNVGIGTTSIANGLSLFKYGTQWTAHTVNTYPQPAGNIFFQMQAVANTDNWFGMTGNYGATTGSANLLLQANLNNTSQQAGHYIASQVISATASDLVFGKMIGGATTGDNSLKSEQMRIDSSGHLLVGTTNASNSVAGFRAYSGGNGAFTIAGQPLELNRLSSDGSILGFQKDGTTVGSIGSHTGGFLKINTAGNSSGLLFGTSAIYPIKNDVIGDNAVDLGDGSNRFKDLYLSSIANIGTYLRFGGASNYYVHSDNANYLRFGTAGSERMRIDSSGNLLVGTTSQLVTEKVSISVTSGSQGIVIAQTDNANAHDKIIFTNTNGIVGYIRTTGTTTAYATSSDQRLKENIADADDAGSKVDAIQVRKYDWKADGSHQDYGMIAQELQAVAPEAVTGDTDSDEMMGVDYSKLVPMLVKEIQSLRARVQQLENN